MRDITRRQFVRQAGIATAGLILLAAGCGGQTKDGGAPATTRPSQAEMPTSIRPTQEATPASTPAQEEVPTATRAVQQATSTATSQPAYLAVARGEDTASITERAIAALGGMGRFVKAGDDVIVKPNICVAYRAPEYAATTNPAVVATLVRLCLEAGARRVRVMDTPFGGTAEAAYAVSGIGEAVKAAGGQMEVMSPVKFVDTPIPEGKDISRWKVYQDVLDADVLIDVPIAKHHSLARLTLGGKNLLGVITDPGRIHRNLGQRVADLVSVIRPDLTVVDAVRILTANGPTGGSLSDVQQANTIIASHDIVAADAWAATLFGMTGSDIGYIKAAAQMDLGTMDLRSIKVEEVNL